LLWQVVAVTTIWDEVIREMLNAARQQVLRRPNDDETRRRVEDLENEWRQRNTLGESPYDLVPECCPTCNPAHCQCSAWFNDVPCTAHNARKGLLASTEAQAPLVFSGIFAMLVVSVVVGVVSLHTSSPSRKPEPWSIMEWSGICLSYALLWTVLSLSSFIRHLWNVLNFGLVMLDVMGAPSNNRCVAFRRLRAPARGDRPPCLLPFWSLCSVILSRGPLRGLGAILLTALHFSPAGVLLCFAPQAPAVSARHSQDKEAAADVASRTDPRHRRGHRVADGNGPEPARGRP